MHVVAHDAQGIELEVIFVLAFFDGVEQHIPTFVSN
jgi:hypothetical protein